MGDISFPHLGITISNLPKGFEIFGFYIAFYGIIIALGMIAGLAIATRVAKRTNQNPELYTDFAMIAIIVSLIGARVYYVVFSWDSYKDNIIDIFNVRQGGLAIYGGVIGAIITAIIFSKVKKYNLKLLLDTGVVGLILGQIIGRFGNFFNREAFGEYTDNILAMRLRYDQVNTDTVTDLMRQHMETVDGVSYFQVHPTFLYESLWNLGVLILLLVFTKRKNSTVRFSCYT